MKNNNTMTLVNLTPHAINIVDTEGVTIQTIAPSGTIARISSKTVTVGEVAGIPVTQTQFGDVENLPEPQDGVVYIVSTLIAQRCAGRDDIFVPGEQVRNEAGQVVGCKSLGRVNGINKQAIIKLVERISSDSFDQGYYQGYSNHFPTASDPEAWSELQKALEI